MTTALTLPRDLRAASRMRSGGQRRRVLAFRDAHFPAEIVDLTHAERKAGHTNDASPRRWALVLLRTLHLIAVIVLGAQILDTVSATPSSTRFAAGIIFVSGLAMLLIDLRSRREYLREAAGIAVVAKLALTGFMALQHAYAVPIFWTIIIISAVVSHAPKSFRHKTLIRSR